jgi:dUTP pyrophosphatase
MSEFGADRQSRGTRKSSTVKIKVKKINPKAKKPKIATFGSACFDLCTCEDLYLVNGTFLKVKTGLIFEIPRGFFIEVMLRSGVASQGVIIPNAPCVIDSDYRGEVLVSLYGLFCKKIVHFAEGSRIAQCRVVKIIPTKFLVVDEVSETQRGTGGFGSTGK